jgi:L-seryl-tRNA(Ser) seleniumtransferase
LLVIDDLGSGTLVDFASYGLSGTKTIRDSLSAGVDLVLLSGDKLLGGPQCGILLGRRDLLEKIAQHPLARVVRADKLALAALAATLRLYRDVESAPHAVPLLSLLSTPLDNLQNRAERLAPQMATCLAIASAMPVPGQASLTSSPASQRIASWCIALTPRDLTVDQLASKLRSGTPAVVGRVKGQQLLLDLRSVPPSLDILLVDAIDQLALREVPNASAQAVSS